MAEQHRRTAVVQALLCREQATQRRFDSQCLKEIAAYVQPGNRQRLAIALEFEIVGPREGVIAEHGQKGAVSPLKHFSGIRGIGHAGFATADVLALYRLRWRIELGFKRLKSLIGLKGPPGTDERSARPHVLAHLLTILLLEPFIDELEDSPRLAEAA